MSQPERENDGVIKKERTEPNVQTRENDAYVRLKRKLIIASVALPTCITLFLTGLLCIGFEAPIGDFAKIVLFFGGGAGMILSFVLTIRFIVQFVRMGRAQTALPPVEVQPQKDDIIRVPVEYNDEAGKNELEEYTVNFLKTVVYPEDFEDFLRNGETTVFIHYYEDGFDVDYFEMDGKYDFDKLKSINLDLIVYADDYHTQFRNVLFFADDLSGHCHFLLDYGEFGEPKVKYLDDEYDEVTLLANSFKEFLENVVTPQKAKELLGKNYYGCYEDEEN